VPEARGKALIVNGVDRARKAWSVTLLTSALVSLVMTQVFLPTVDC
jgi:hypothetical protein